MENILPGETGVVVAAGDENALYQAMAGLVADPELLRAMGRAGRAYAASRTIEQAFEDYWEMYTDCGPAMSFESPEKPKEKPAKPEQRLVHAA